MNLNKALRVLKRKGLSVALDPDSPLRNLLPRTKIDYRNEVGEGYGSSTVMAPLLWIMRTYPEAPIAINKDDDVIDDHRMIALLRKPNPFYSGRTLAMGTILSFTGNGNAYWLKVRNAMLEVIELWYIPHWLIEPKWPDTNNVFISHYEYRVGAKKIKLKPEDVVHFRYGLDPMNIRKGLSPLASIYREVFTDDEAANFSAAMLKNGGVPGLVISPDSVPNQYGTIVVTDPDKNAVKEFFKTKFGGDKRGEPLVLSAPTKVEQFGFNPEEMNLASLRAIPEERVTAVLGIPSAVVGFGSGLEQTKVGATMAELREMAYEGCIIPLQEMHVEQITNQLLPDFEPEPNDYKVYYDRSKVRVLQEDENKKSERFISLVKGSLLTREEGRVALGFDPTPTEGFFLEPLNIVAVRACVDPTIIEPTPEPKRLQLKSRKIQEYQTRLVQLFYRDINILEKVYADKAIKRFNEYGKRAGEIFLQEVERSGFGKSIDVEKKTSEVEIEVLVNKIVARLGEEYKKEELLQFVEHYLLVAETTIESINGVLELGVMMDAPIETRVISAGGRRLGLIDLDAQTKKALFEKLTEMREAGLGPLQMVDQISEIAGAGPWKTAEIRAKVIGRTETKYAQNISSIEVYKVAETIGALQIVDGQLETSDDNCIARDGLIVSFSDGDWIADDEHPNGTLSFTPVFGTPESFDTIRPEV